MNCSFILLLKFLIGETKIIIVKYENVHNNYKCLPYSFSQNKKEPMKKFIKHIIIFPFTAVNVQRCHKV